jgi:LPS sulfotransferase NodH
MKISETKIRLKKQLKRIILNNKFHPRDDGFQSGKKLFFVTGRGKSGTTWLAQLLNSHPTLFCDPTENLGFHQDFRFDYLATCQELLYDGLGEHLNDKTWRLIKNGVITNLINKCNKISAQKLGDKTPDQDLSRIFGCFPQTKVVVILRDFRDTCVSWAFHAARSTARWEGLFDGPDKQNLDNNFLRAILTYYAKKKDFAHYSRFASERPEQVIIVRYEDMKQAPVKTFRGVLTFLGVDSADSQVNNCLQSNTFERSAKGRHPGETDAGSFFRKGITGDWRNHFSHQNVGVFKEIAGDLLIASGYEKDDQWGL